MPNNFRKADYSRIADQFDLGRTLSGTAIETWLRLIAQHIDEENMQTLLDLGCGTGRFALPIARRFRLSVTGADLSPEMLSKAIEKDLDKLVRWHIQDAEHLTYSDELFDIVFLSQLLQHVEHSQQVIREVHRVLRPGGVLLIRYAGLEQVQTDVEHVFFPEALLVDQLRYPTVTKVEEWLTTAGFKMISSEEVVQQSYQSAEAHLNAVEIKCMSVLTLISEDSFQEGTYKLRAYIEENPHDPWLLTTRLTLTVGRKSS